MSSSASNFPDKDWSPSCLFLRLTTVFHTSGLSAMCCFLLWTLVLPFPLADVCSSFRVQEQISPQRRSLLTIHPRPWITGTSLKIYFSFRFLNDSFFRFLPGSHPPYLWAPGLWEQVPVPTNGCSLGHSKISSPKSGWTLLLWFTYLFYYFCKNTLPSNLSFTVFLPRILQNSRSHTPPIFSRLGLCNITSKMSSFRKPQTPYPYTTPVSYLICSCILVLIKWIFFEEKVRTNHFIHLLVSHKWAVLVEEGPSPVTNTGQFNPCSQHSV